MSGPDLWRRLRARLVLPNPTDVGSAQHSMILFDEHGPPSARLFDIALAAVQQARHEDLSAVSQRIVAGPRWPDFWPGEHYRLLAGLVRVLAPKLVVEIGTYQGHSALALAHALPQGSAIHSFDVVPWQGIPGQTLRPSDVESGRIVPVLDDLRDAAVFDRHRSLIERADLIFLDAAKDGRMEQVLLDRFATVRFAGAPLFVLDDIRVWNMLRIWREVRRPKLDITSFGHWSGTGLIDWCAEPDIRPRQTGGRDRG